MKIAVFAPFVTSSRGGLERFACRLTSWLSNRGHECFLFTNTMSKKAKPVYPLDERVQQVGFKNITGIQFNRAQLRQHSPDVFCVLGSNTHIIPAVLAAHGSGIPLIISERVSPFAVMKRHWNKVDRLAMMSGADYIHLLCEEYVRSLPPELSARARVIPNAVPEMNLPDGKKKKREKIILSVSRLEEGQKQLSLLILAFTLLSPQFPDWRLHLCGTGPSLESYKALITKHKMEDKIILRGVVEDVEKEYERAAIFCLPSVYEGMSNALLESQVCGLPAVVFSGCLGMGDIVRNGENGLLVDKMDITALKEALQTLMADGSLRSRLGHYAKKLSRRYDIDVVYRQWEELFENAARLEKTNMDFPLDDDYEAARKGLAYILAKTRHDKFPQMSNVFQNLRARMQSR